MNDADQTLAPRWRSWVVDNLLRGASTDELVEALVSQGVPAAVAAREVSATAASPLLPVCAELTVAVERRGQLLGLLGELREDAPIERRERVSADELFARYWATATPVVLTEQIRDWPALTRWSLESLRERLGEVTIEACTGRDADPLCDRRFKEHIESMTMADYLDRVAAAGVSNDLYMIAHNRTMEREGARPLLDDVIVDDALFDRDELIGGCTLWVGPAGTRTPLHHDSTNILFCQIVGTKRFHLIAPLSEDLLDDAQGFYATFDPTTPREQWPEAHRELTVHEVLLAPGEALFLPAGWWHRVEALEPSISFSLLCFRRPNRFDDYAPGTVRVVKGTVVTEAEP